MGDRKGLKISCFSGGTHDPSSIETKLDVKVSTSQALVRNSP